MCSWQRRFLFTRWHFSHRSIFQSQNLNDIKISIRLTACFLSVAGINFLVPPQSIPLRQYWSYIYAAHHPYCWSRGSVICDDSCLLFRETSDWCRHASPISLSNGERWSAAVGHKRWKFLRLILTTNCRIDTPTHHMTSSWRMVDSTLLGLDYASHSVTRCAPWTSVHFQFL